MFSKDFISAFNIFSISAMSLFSEPYSPFSIKSQSLVNDTYIIINANNNPAYPDSDASSKAPV